MPTLASSDLYFVIGSLKLWLHGDKFTARD